jgi:DNA-binding MarR family transcriptional regulator
MDENVSMASRKTYLRNLLLQRFDWMEERVLERAVVSGYAYITPAMNRLFAHMWGQPVGLSELSRRLGISRQAVHKLASEAARHGLVEFVASTEDARVVMLRFTEAGWAMSARAARDLASIEAAIAAKLGAAKVAQLKALLAEPWSDEEA